MKQQLASKLSAKVETKAKSGSQAMQEFEALPAAKPKQDSVSIFLSSLQEEAKAK